MVGQIISFVSAKTSGTQWAVRVTYPTLWENFKTGVLIEEVLLLLTKIYAVHMTDTMK